MIPTRSWLTWLTLIALLAGCTSAGRAGDEGVVPAEPPLTEPAVTAPAVSDPVAPHLPEVSVELGDLAPSSVIVRSVALSDVPPLPPSFVPAALPVDIEVADGVVDEPVVLSAPATDVGDGTPAALHLDAFGQWAVEPVVVEAERLVTVASSFSPWVLGWFGDDSWLDSAVDWLTGRTDPPRDCEHTTYPWVSTSGTIADGTIHACVKRNPRSDGTERVEVKIKSNRNAFQIVNLPEGDKDFLWVEGMPEWLRAVTMAVLGQDPERQILLPPGRTMTVGYLQPVGSGQRRTFSTYQDSRTTALTAVLELTKELPGLAFTVMHCSGLLDPANAFNVDPANHDLTTSLAECTFTKVLEAAASFATDRREATIAHGRALIERGLLTPAHLERLSESAHRWSTAATTLKLAGKAVLAGQLLSRASSLWQDILTGSIVSANEWTLQLTPLPATGRDEAPTVSETAPGEWTISFSHPARGRSRLVVRSSVPQGRPIIEGFGADGQRFFHRDADGAIGLWLRGGVTEIFDALGHIFVGYDYGRDPGALILRPTPQGFDVFDFYSASPIDTDGDGVWEIKTDDYDCEPSCAESTRMVLVHAWSGSDYVLSAGYMRGGPQSYSFHGSSGLLVKYHTGPRVRALQALLRTAGELGTEPDGDFGPNTEAAVRRFQSRAGLPTTGITDGETFHALDMAAGGIGFASLEDADRVITGFLNSGAGVPPTSWIAEDLRSLVADPGDAWQSTGGRGDDHTLSYAYFMGEIGIVTVLDIEFRQRDGRYWYAGQLELRGH